MRQGRVEIRDEGPKALRSLIADEISSEVQMRDHFSVSQESAEFFDVLVVQVLTLCINHVWCVDTPSFDC